MEIIPFVKKLWAETISPSLVSMAKADKENSERIIEAIQSKESPTAFEITNPDEISNPVKEAIESIKFPEPLPYPTETAINNPSDISNPIVERLKGVEGAIRDGREVVVKNDLSQLIGLFKTTKDKGDILKVLKEIRDKESVSTDYTLMLDEMMTILERPADTTEIKKLQDLVKKLGTHNDLVDLSEWLRAIAEKEYPEPQEIPIKDGRVLVSVDKAGGGGGGGLTSVESSALQRMGRDYDTLTVNKDDPANIIITKKLGDVVVDTKTIKIL
jgi:hypothetical protein